MRQVATELAHKRFLEPIPRKTHGVVRFSQVPLCGEEGLMASLSQHRSQSPLRNGQTARLALDSNRGHTAPVGNAAGLYGCASGRATRLRIEGEERHPFGRNAIQIRRGHAAARSSAVNTGAAVTKVVG